MSDDISLYYFKNSNKNNGPLEFLVFYGSSGSMKALTLNTQNMFHLQLEGEPVASHSHSPPKSPPHFSSGMRFANRTPGPAAWAILLLLASFQGCATGMPPPATPPPTLPATPPRDATPALVLPHPDEQLLPPMRWDEDGDQAPDRWLLGAMNLLRAGMTEVADGQYTWQEPTGPRDPRRLEVPPTVTRALISLLDSEQRLTYLPLLGLTVVENPERQTYEIRGLKMGFPAGFWLGYEMLDQREILATLQWAINW